MLEIKSNLPRKGKVLLDVEFGLNEFALSKQQQVMSAEDISVLSGKKNKLSVGEPEVFNLAKLLKEKGADIPVEVKLMLDDYDFYQVRYVCTFIPAEDCKFTWARFGIKLSGKAIDKKLEDKLPIAYDMYPREVNKEVKIKRTWNIGPNFQFQGFIEFGAGLAGEQEFIKYEPEIVSFGLLQSNPCWDFKKSKAKEYIMGDKELFMILKAPKGMKVEAEFVFGAEVHTFWGKFPMIPKNKSVVKGKYIING